MPIRKKWLNQLKNFFNKHFKNIIWHLFAGESYQVVKITVTEYTVLWIGIVLMRIRIWIRLSILILIRIQIRILPQVLLS